MNILETDRLILRKITTDDAAFILELLNQPSFIRFIGDRGVRNLDDARAYISNRFIAAYERLGYSMYLTLLKENGTPIGICGLVKRDVLDDPDIGYAFLPQYWLKGYAFEITSAMMNYAKNNLGLKHIFGVVAPDNPGSIRVLEKLGLKFQGMIKLSADDIELKLFG